MVKRAHEEDEGAGVCSFESEKEGSSTSQRFEFATQLNGERLIGNDRGATWSKKSENEGSSHYYERVTVKIEPITK